MYALHEHGAAVCPSCARGSIDRTYYFFSPGGGGGGDGGDGDFHDLNDDDDFETDGGRQMFG